MKTPIPRQIVDQAKKESGLVDMGKASIREVLRLVNNIEKASGQQFVKMEMGVPGLPAASVGIEAQKDALQKGVASIYPSIEGFQGLKEEASRFAKLFLDIDIAPAGCVPTVGSMQGSLTAFMVNSRCDARKEYTLFIDPGFGAKTTTSCFGSEIQNFRCVQSSWRQTSGQTRRIPPSRRCTHYCLFEPQQPFVDLFFGKRIENHWRIGWQVRCDGTGGSCLFRNGFSPRLRKTRSSSLPTVGGALYRQLYPAVFGVKNFQLCRRTNSPDVNG